MQTYSLKGWTRSNITPPTTPQVLDLGLRRSIIRFKMWKDSGLYCQFSTGKLYSVWLKYFDLV